MSKLKKYLPWSIRIFIFIMFMVSGIAKMFPIWAFEKQFVDLGFASWCNAPYFARFIIALEIAIGIGILQPHFLKRFVIPVTVILLAAFCVHLSMQMYAHGAMTGNCGCFGQLIPMTPLEAFIKNVVCIALLIYLYKHVNDREKGQNKFVYIILIYLASALFMFVFFPFSPCKNIETVVPEVSLTDSVKNLPEAKDTTNTTAVKQGNTDNKDAAIKDSTPIVVEEKGPPKIKSRYSSVSTFSNKKVDLDAGKKILCLFAAGCDHCRHTAKELHLLAKKISLPPIYVIFMNEEIDQIPDFFKEAETKFPYTIIEVPAFWNLIGSNADTPGVVFLWNGNIIKFYEGLDANKFNVQEFEKVISNK